MICVSCGSQIPDGSMNCPNCGAPQQAQQPMYQQPMYQQPMYQQPMYQNPVQPARGLAIAALVCGIISFFLFPVVTGVLGVVFGGVAKSKGNTSAMATAGIVCGILGVVLWLLMLMFLDSLFSFMLF